MKEEVKEEMKKEMRGEMKYGKKEWLVNKSQLELFKIVEINTICHKVVFVVLLHRGL